MANVSQTSKVESGRWAVIVKDTGQVSEIKAMSHGRAPDLRNPDAFDLEEVSRDVQIGMVRSGKGFAWPSGYDGGNRGTPGSTRYADEDDKKNPTPQPEDMKPTPGSGPIAGAVSDKAKEKNAADAQRADAEAAEAAAKNRVSATA